MGILPKNSLTPNIWFLLKLVQDRAEIGRYWGRGRLNLKSTQQAFKTRAEKHSSSENKALQTLGAHISPFLWPLFSCQFIASWTGHVNMDSNTFLLNLPVPHKHKHTLRDRKVTLRLPIKAQTNARTREDDDTGSVSVSQADYSPDSKDTPCSDNSSTSPSLRTLPRNVDIYTQGPKNIYTYFNMKHICLKA